MTLPFSHPNVPLATAQVLVRMGIHGLSCCGKGGAPGGDTPMNKLVNKAAFVLFAMAHQHRSLRGDLPKALAFISTEFQVPIIAEIVGDESGEMVITKDNSWEDIGGVVHVYDKELRHSAGNFLNTKLKSFKLSNNISDLKINLRAQLYSSAQGLTGVVVSDLPSRELSESRLLGAPS